MCKDINGKVRFSTMDMISSGKTGQTSATGTAGIVLCFLSVVVILALTTMYFINPNEAGNVLAFFDKITVVLAIGAALLGTRKISGVIASKSASNVVDLVEDTVYSIEAENKIRAKHRKSYDIEYDDEGECIHDQYADNYEKDENVEN